MFNQIKANSQIEFPTLNPVVRIITQPCKWFYGREVVADLAQGTGLQSYPGHEKSLSYFRKPMELAILFFALLGTAIISISSRAHQNEFKKRKVAVLEHQLSKVNNAVEAAQVLKKWSNSDVATHEKYLFNEQ